MHHVIRRRGPHLGRAGCDILLAETVRRRLFEALEQVAVVSRVTASDASQILEEAHVQAGAENARYVGVIGDYRESCETTDVGQLCLVLNHKIESR